MPRDVTLVLQTTDGALVGTLAPFTVELPWWPEVFDVVEAARTERGAEVTVLRLLHAEPDPDDASGMGGSVTYVAELHGPVPPDLRATDARTAAQALDDEPLRLPFARPGGPARDLAWAEQALASRGRTANGRARQIRTCNLSSIWSIPTADGTVWLKSVPPFFAHEGRIIEWLADPALPTLVGATDGRVLMAEIAGTDQWDAPPALLVRAVASLVAIQDRVSGRIDELLAIGLPDWRWAALRPLIDDVVARHRHELEVAEQRALDTVVAGLGPRCDAIDACGLPTTLVHGDFHRGNLRSDGASLCMLDWSDCGVGHPMLDMPAMLEPLDPAPREAVRASWIRAWQERCADADPASAATLLAPIAALRQAVIYRSFLDGIEPSERCYHAKDPAHWLRKAAAFAAMP